METNESCTIMQMDILTALALMISEGRCIVFVGAGLSQPAGLPSWSGLIANLVEVTLKEMRAGQSGQGLHQQEQEIRRLEEQELERLKEKGDFLEIAELCREKIGHQRYQQFLADNLRGSRDRIPATYRIIARLPFRAIVTTNYDNLLEWALEDERRGFKVLTNTNAPSLGRILFAEPFFLLKAHGDVDDPDSIILTRSDYTRITHQNPAFNTFFSALLMGSALLFLGYSLSDPNMRLLLDQQLATFRDVPPRYALMAGIGPQGKDYLKKTAGIEVQSFEEGQYGKVLEFLEELEKRVDDFRTGAVPVGSPEGGQADSSGAVAEGAVGPPSRGGPRGIVERVRQPSVGLRIRRVGREIIAMVRDDSGQLIAEGTGFLPLWSDLKRILGGAADILKSGTSWADRIEPVREAGRVLSAAIARDVLAVLADPTKVSDDTVIILRLDSETETLPWEWLLVDGLPLCQRQAVARAPVAVSEKARGQAYVRSPARVLLIGVKDKEMPGAIREVESIKKAYDELDIPCDALLDIRGNATFLEVARHFRFGQYDLIHFAGHAWYDGRDAYLKLQGRDVMRSGELDIYLRQSPPAMMILNSHFTAFVPPGVRELPVDPLMKTVLRRDPSTKDEGHRGFNSIAETIGVGALIGCLASIDDEISADFGLKLHEQLLAGLPIGRALREARRSCLEGGGLSPIPLSYTLSGHPGLALCAADS